VLVVQQSLKELSKGIAISIEKINKVNNEAFESKLHRPKRSASSSKASIYKLFEGSFRSNSLAQFPTKELIFAASNLTDHS